MKNDRLAAETDIKMRARFIRPAAIDLILGGGPGLALLQNMSHFDLRIQKHVSTEEMDLQQLRLSQTTAMEGAPIWTVGVLALHLSTANPHEQRLLREEQARIGSSLMDLRHWRGMVDPVRQ